MKANELRFNSEGEKRVLLEGICVKMGKQYSVENSNTLTEGSYVQLGSSTELSVTLKFADHTNNRDAALHQLHPYLIIFRPEYHNML